MGLFDRAPSRPKIIIKAGPHQIETAYTPAGINRAVSFLQSLKLPQQEKKEKA